MAEDLADIIATLRARRAEHAASISLLDAAIDNLTRLTGGSTEVPLPGVEVKAEVPSAVREAIGRRLAGNSVRALTLALLDEAPRDWSADEVVEEYERRGSPFTVQDPRNAMFSAFSRLSREGHIVRTGHGRYVAKRYAALHDPEDVAADEALGASLGTTISCSPRATPA